MMDGAAAAGAGGSDKYHSFAAFMLRIAREEPLGRQRQRLETQQEQEQEHEQEQGLEQELEQKLEQKQDQVETLCVHDSHPYNSCSLHTHTHTCTKPCN